MNLSILFIDDEPDLMELGLRGLRGFDVKTASNVKDGLKKIEEGNIDLLLTDWDLEPQTSQEVVEKALEKGIGVIIQTGMGEEGREKLHELFSGQVEVKGKTTIDYAQNLRGFVEGWMKNQGGERK